MQILKVCCCPAVRRAKTMNGTHAQKKKLHKRNAQYNRNHLVLKEGVPTYLLGPVDFSLLGFHAIGYSLRSMYILIFVNRSPVDCSQTTVLYTND